MNRLFSPPQLEMFSHPVTGRVEEAIAPNFPGRIYCMASYWPAKFYQHHCTNSLVPGQPCKVVGIEGITLLVVPL
ncbi:NfeD family protein [Laspinema olomoucense]|uniref:NfeD family protein n=1 Tax=Laspinema olomoucense TaxID=3231600 RepID=UPI0021BB7646|nr:MULTISPECIES: NfeD family protein [unclassified Laspinema]MCT7972960.1 NfeD family protein [Laspinema sp. D3d]MCT7987069.1 NfeD family protein [Laspinema sp. D3a]